MAENRKVVMRTNSLGERFAGYWDEVTGTFKTVMVIHNDNDMDSFIDKYDITYVRIENVL
ncbi:MAG: hypothetical protein K6G40_06995 [Eubacterium sp.]|nr:hypothetical protein [Eubacterium sp.]